MFCVHQCTKISTQVQCSPKYDQYGAYTSTVVVCPDLIGHKSVYKLLKPELAPECVCPTNRNIWRAFERRGAASRLPCHDVGVGPVAVRQHRGGHAAATKEGQDSSSVRDRRYYHL
jgi:hypothetical protein